MMQKIFNKTCVRNIFLNIIFVLISSVICLKEDSLGFQFYLLPGSNPTVVCRKPDWGWVVNNSEAYNFDHIQIGSWRGECDVPQISYSEILSRLNVNVTCVKNIFLKMSYGSTVPLTSAQFQGLENLEILEINADDIKSPILPPSNYFLEPLKQLVSFTMYGYNCPTFPETSQIRHVTLVRGSSPKEFGGCLKLERLEIMQWNLDAVKGRFWEHCPVLKYLKIDRMELMRMAVLKRVLAGLKTLRELTVTKCSLEYLRQEDDLLSESLLLERIDLSDNKIVEIWLPQLPKVTYLDLTRNQIDNRDLIIIIMSNMNLLKELHLNGNLKLNMCQFNRIYGVTVTHMNLEKLVLTYTASNELCFEQLMALQLLELDFNSLTVLDFKGLPKSQAPELIINLNYNGITQIIFDEEDYLYMSHETYALPGGDEFRHGSIRIIMWAKLSCDCENGWLLKAIRNLPNFQLDPVSGEPSAVVCSDNRNLFDVPRQQVECSKYKCAENCTCRSYWENNEVRADCNKAELRAIPNITDVTTLLASNNYIEDIGTNIPENLTYLDITKNYVKRMNPEALTKFFDDTQRRLKLAGNPIACDCESKEFLEILKVNHDKIEDYESILCNDDKPFSEVNLEDLCKSDNWQTIVPPSTIVGVLLALIAVIAAAYFKYKREIRVFLYSHGCMCLVRVEELDADLQYDAFISYSHENEDFVVETLVPGLENEPHRFSVCLHGRDWVPGEFIPAQIIASVENSRRTIIVMSRQYLTSPWCMLEFRTAHEETLKVGRPRVIIVLLEDVSELETLDSELKSYLKNYTYLKSNDSRFWQKLRYAMPHRNL